MKSFAAIAAGLLVSTSAYAVQLPPEGSPFYLQTDGPASDIGRGDWYSSDENGIGPGSHFFSIDIPPNWDPNTPVHLDIESPWFNADPFSGTEPNDEEQEGPPAPVEFELFPAGTPIDMLDTRTPAPNTGIAGTRVQYNPVDRSNIWVRYYTFQPPVEPGNYVLRTRVVGNSSISNAFRLRLGRDNDSNPNNTPPSGFSVNNPDTIFGSGDELAIGFYAATFQHNGGNDVCGTYHHYVDPGTPSIRFHNFDMDGNNRIRYYSPTAPFDPNANTGGVSGTVSGGGVWNNGGTDTTRVGDPFTSPIPGWWHIALCINDQNQWVIEGQNGRPIYMNQGNTTFQPPTPVPGIAITDGESAVGPSDELTYVVPFNNSASGVQAGILTNPVITITVDPQLSITPGSISLSGQTGNISVSGNTITVTLDGFLAAGESGQVIFTAIGPPTEPSSSVTTSASLTGEDQLGNVIPPVSGFDTNNPTPLLAVMNGMSATPMGEDMPVLLQWSTSLEIDNAGFRVLRAVPNGEGWSPGDVLTENLIAGAGTEFDGADYSFVDPVPMAVGEKRAYFIQDVDFMGTETLHGPVIAAIPLRFNASVGSWRAFE